MVIVEKTDDYQDIAVGDILVYQRANTIMVHRVTDIIEDSDMAGGHLSFQTKGDANQSNDNWVVEPSDIVGISKAKIAMFGYPTLWLNELFNAPTT